MKASCLIFLRKAKLSHYVNKVMLGNQGDPPPYHNFAQMEIIWKQTKRWKFNVHLMSHLTRIEVKRVELQKL